MTADNMMKKNNIYMISLADHNRRWHGDEEQSCRPNQFACEAMSKPDPPLPRLQSTIFSRLTFIVSNEVDGLDKQVWVVQLVLIEYPGR
jgi:hypothetical protein